MEEMATKAQKKENSSLQRRQTDVRQEKLLSSQRYSLSELAKPLHCHGGSSSLAGLYPKLSVVQAKLVVGPADDEYEREADRVAEQAIRMPKTPVQRQADEREEEEIQTKPLSGQITHLIQRQGGEEEVEEKLQASSMIQKAGTKGGQAWPELEESLEQARGGGKPLTEGFRGRMESAFGADFGGVRIHTSNVAAQLNRAINAQAFTHGRDIYLGEGKTDLKSYNWRHLLAHELTHTIQQGESKLRNQAKMKNGSIRNNKENKADLETDQEMKIPYQESQENNSQIQHIHPGCCKGLQRQGVNQNPPNKSSKDPTDWNSLPEGARKILTYSFKTHKKGDKSEWRWEDHNTAIGCFNDGEKWQDDSKIAFLNVYKALKSAGILYQVKRVTNVFTIYVDGIRFKPADRSELNMDITQPNGGFCRDSLDKHKWRQMVGAGSRGLHINVPDSGECEAHIDTIAPNEGKDSKGKCTHSVGKVVKHIIKDYLGFNKSIFIRFYEAKRKIKDLLSKNDVIIDKSKLKELDKELKTLDNYMKEHALKGQEGVNTAEKEKGKIVSNIENEISEVINRSMGVQ